ncbi:hypothetical protein AAG570_009470 [Ranatra chinensis]|uniref:27 kDa hemolymph protein n=1 Tax=Ranatra chinensis TaxID=642074 RepID=A0ABD0ZCG3_9HEMI
MPAGNLPSMDEANQLLRDKCLKNGNNESYEAAVAAKDNMGMCISSTINWTAMANEIEEAKPKGELDTVFKKYCGKSPELKRCVSNFTSSMEGCLSENERQSKNVVENITDSLMNFICYQEVFIAEGGPECINSKMEDIIDCVGKTFSKYVPEDGINNSTDLPEFSFNDEHCKDMNKLESCVVARLERCSESTPANIVGSLFKFIRKSTPCAKSTTGSLKSSDGSGNSASSLGVSIILLIFVSAIVTRFTFH